MRESTKVHLKRCFVDKIAILAEKSHDSFARIVDVMLTMPIIMMIGHVASISMLVDCLVDRESCDFSGSVLLEFSVSKLNALDCLI